MRLCELRKSGEPVDEDSPFGARIFSKLRCTFNMALKAVVFREGSVRFAVHYVDTFWKAFVSLSSGQLSSVKFLL